MIGIVGAFGKTKAISSNFPLLLKFSAIGILKSVRISHRSNHPDTISHTILRHCFKLAEEQENYLGDTVSVPVSQSMCPNYRCCVFLQCWNHKRCWSRHDCGKLAPVAS